MQTGVQLLESDSARTKEFRDSMGAIHVDWENARDLVMRKALNAKFSQHPDMARILRATGSAVLVARGSDKYWCTSDAGDGGNRMGEILVQVRSELQQNTEIVTTSACSGKSE